jgi:hypothetical protein
MLSVADLMVQEHMSFSHACQALGVKFDTTAAERASQYSEAFQNILDALSFKFYARIGDNPLLTKGVLSGTLMTAIRHLGEQGKWAEVHMPGKLLADLMGWLETTTEAPVLGNLTQADIDRIRKDLKDAEEKQREADQKGTPVHVILVGEPGKKPN